MKKSFSFRTLHRISGGFVLAIILAVAGFGTYLWFTYGDLLVGQVQLDASPSILTHLSTDKFDQAKKLLETRQALPYPSANLPNPFYVAPAAPPPAPVTPSGG